MIHQPVSVVSQCGAGAWLNGLASGDQRRLMGSGSTSEAKCNDVVYKSIVALLYSLAADCIAVALVDSFHDVANELVPDLSK